MDAIGRKRTGWRPNLTIKYLAAGPSAPRERILSTLLRTVGWSHHEELFQREGWGHRSPSRHAQSRPSARVRQVSCRSHFHRAEHDRRQHRAARWRDQVGLKADARGRTAARAAVLPAHGEEASSTGENPFRCR
eukprot:scaffold193996_cov32-Tisochrysis_lutea.AAC.2